MALLVFFHTLSVELDVVKRIADQAVRVCCIDGARRVGENLVIDAAGGEHDRFSVGQPRHDLFADGDTIAALRALIGPADVLIRKHPTAAAAEYELLGEDQLGFREGDALRRGEFR